SPHLPPHLPLTLFSFTDPPTPHIYPLSLHDALPIWHTVVNHRNDCGVAQIGGRLKVDLPRQDVPDRRGAAIHQDLNSRDGSGKRSEEPTSELQSLTNLVCPLLLEKKKNTTHQHQPPP